jgi:phage terminase large subunit-like protein
MKNIIYDDTHEHDKEFMIERINKLTEYLAIEKNKSFLLQEQNATLQRELNKLQTKITILESKTKK